MARGSVLYRKRLETVGKRQVAVSLEEGISAVKSMAEMKADRTYKNGKKRKGTDQTVEIVMHLGIDPKRADQMLRGAISLPKGIGKSRSVIAFCDADTVEAAKEAGAVDAGGDELVKRVSDGWMDFDVAIAHPSMMGKVGKLGRILGPAGKMPTPKAGTVTPDIADAVKEFASGRMEFRNDAGGNIHLPVGKASFPDSDLRENIEAVVAHMKKVKPVAAKGTYIKRVCLAATHTPSVTVDVESKASS